MNYSVLMSVYAKENPVFFRIAMESIFKQTHPVDDFVLVCDGKLGSELENVINYFKNKYPNTLNVVRYAENKGLGYALNLGLSYCKNEIILRADSDDISLPNRAEMQIKKFIEDGVDLSSTNINLFEEDIEKVIGKRSVPIFQKDIIKFSKTRSPFNHPSAIFKKTEVLKAGNYKTLLYKEDYYLWIRMLQKKCKVNNINIPLVYMRINSETFFKRKNKIAYKSAKWLNNYMLKTKYITFATYIKNKLIYFCRQYMPSFFISKLTKKMWEKH